MNIFSCSNRDGDSKRREALCWHVSVIGITNIINHDHQSHHHYKFIIIIFNSTILPTIMFISFVCLITLINPIKLSQHIIITNLLIIIIVFIIIVQL